MGPTAPRATPIRRRTLQYRLVFKGTSAPNAVNYLLAWDITGTHVRFLVNIPPASSRPTAIQASTWPTDGSWHLVVGVYTGTALLLYLDGVQIASASASGALATTSAALTVSDNSTTSLTGDVDEVAVWNKVLTPTQISTFYAIGHP